MILCTGAAVEVARLNNFPLMVMTIKMISFKSNAEKNNLFIGQPRERERLDRHLVASLTVPLPSFTIVRHVDNLFSNACKKNGEEKSIHEKS